MSQYLGENFQKVKFFSKDWFLALWNGERPLWEAWWVLGTSALLVIAVICLFITQILPHSMLSVAILGGVTLALQIFWLVAVWRCAPNIHNNIWTYVARTVLVLGIISSLYDSFK